MKRLIVNADDFGLHENINYGIIKGHTKGCITSTSLMAGGKAFEHALSLAEAQPELGIGVHLTLVGAYPVTDPGRIPTLVDGEGLLCRDYPAFLKKFCFGKIRLEDIRQELAAQVKAVLAAGVTITHLDSHQHMHIVPGIIDVVLDIAKEFTIRAMRIPAEPLAFFGGFKPSAGRVIGRSGLTILARLAGRKARQAGLAVPDHFFGMLAGGSMEERLLLTVMDCLPPGSTEIMIHPGLDDAILNAYFGWNYNWQTELAAVTSSQVAEKLAKGNIELCSFAGLARK
ncbi:Chitooligosaccharide deacetylase ChbG [Sporomusa carbonis]|uniref:ChbG/HpnK family deacetylase n=1 Tax=Sporomusa carbonis TaxID=3076075 RepID=UPI003A7A8C0A